MNEQFQDDGAFWIGLDDFVWVYRALYVCRTFDTKKWKRFIKSGEWKGKTAAGLPSRDNPKAKIANNPHYGITVSRASTLFVELRQN